ALLALSGPLAWPESPVIKLRDFKLAATRERQLPFDVAATPSGDIVSCVADSMGTWRLHRVRNWLSASPTEAELPLPDYFSKADAPEMKALGVRVFVRDERYATCVGSAVWQKQAKGRLAERPRSEDVMSVVDL